MDMIPKVRDWLEKQGFSLEMRTAAAFRAADFEVRQSIYYIDAETNKPREMDVEAISRSPIGAVDVRFLVECKSSDKPWVLLCSPDTLNGYSRLLAFSAMSVKCREVVSKRSSDFDNKLSWWRKNAVIAAYALRQAFSENDSAYSAAINVTKACQHRVTDITPYKRSGDFCFAFPVIVVDTPILRCVLNDKGEIELQQADEAEFLFSGHELGTCIRVINIDSLPAFALYAKGVAEVLQDELRDEEKRLHPFKYQPLNIRILCRYSRSREAPSRL